MSQTPDNLQACPNCGQENAAHSLKCIRCGEMLESLFAFDDFELSEVGEENENQDFTTSISEVMASLVESPLLEQENTDLTDEASEPEEDKDAETRREHHEQMPEWLLRIRQRAQDEEAGGELAKGAKAIDARREGEGRDPVDAAFDGMLKRIREQAENDKRNQRRQETNLVDENGDPEWLRRIRELHPKHESDATGLPGLPDSSDELDDDWTEEELKELLRREIGTQYLEDQPLIFGSAKTENEIASEEPYTEDDTQIVPEDFHNIPDDDYEENLIPLPEQTDETDLVEESFEPDDNESGLEAGEENAEPPNEEMAGLDIENSTNPEERPDTDGEDFETQSDEAGALASEDRENFEERPAPDQEEVQDAPDPDAEEDNHNLNSKPENELEEQILPDLMVLRDQRDRARILSNIIEQEGRRTLSVWHEKSRQSRLGRLILAFLLIAGVLGSLILGVGTVPNLPVSAAAAAFDENLESISAGQSILIILDYQAATSVEIEAVAKPVLEELLAVNTNLRFLTAQPADLWLVEGLFDAENKPVREVEYVPGGMLGYLSLAAGSNPSWGQTPIAGVIENSENLFRETDQILIISDSSEFIRLWLEQVAPWWADLPVFAISTALSSPYLLPYFESQQIGGFVAGLPDNPSQMANGRAWQAGMMIMLVVLLLGMISKMDADATKREQERNDAAA